jgi:ribbon-helix-helix protein
MAFPTERSRRVFLGPFPSEQIPGEPSSLRSVKTSVSLEDAFWDGLKESAAGETLPVSLSRRDRFRAARTICHPRFASSHSTFIARPSDEAGRDAAEDIFGTIAVFERHKRSLKYGTQDYRLNRCADSDVRCKCSNATNGPAICCMAGCLRPFETEIVMELFVIEIVMELCRVCLTMRKRGIT